MKYTMKSNYISFNKMKNNECHVEVRLFDKKRQQLKIGDVIEFVNSRTQEKLLTQLRGIAIFENFEDMVASSKSFKNLLTTGKRSSS